MSFSKRVGLNIRFFRRQQGLKQKELAERIGRSPNYVSQLEHGKKNPSLKLLTRIADVFKKHPIDIFGGDQEVVFDLLVLFEKYDPRRVVKAIHEEMKKSE